MVDKLNINKNTILKVIENSIALDGIDKAKENIEFLNRLFAAEPGWAETKRAADQLMISEIKKDKKEKRREKLEDLRTRRPKVYLKVNAEAKAHHGHVRNKFDQVVVSPKDNTMIVRHNFTDNIKNNKEK